MNVMSVAEPSPLNQSSEDIRKLIKGKNSKYDECEKAFNEKSGLRLLQRTHTGVLNVMSMAEPSPTDESSEDIRKLIKGKVCINGINVGKPSVINRA